MSDGDRKDQEKQPPKDIDEKMRRSVSRRGFLTGEMGRSAAQAAKFLPGFGPLLGIAMKGAATRRDELRVNELWTLLVGREPKPHENEASLQMVRKAISPEEKGDALVDIVWALCQTQEFEELKRPNDQIVHGFYRIAMGREPTEEEKLAALRVIGEAEAEEQKASALEGLFTGLVRSWDSVLRKQA